MTYYVSGPIISIFIVRDLFILYFFLPGQNIYSFSCMCFVLILVLISSIFPFCGYFCIILPVIWFIHIGELTLWSSFSYSRQLHHIIIFVPVFFLPSPTDPFLGEGFAFSILTQSAWGMTPQEVHGPQQRFSGCVLVDLLSPIFTYFSKAVFKVAMPLIVQIIDEDSIPYLAVNFLLGRPHLITCDLINFLTLQGLVCESIIHHNVASLFGYNIA